MKTYKSHGLTIVNEERGVWWTIVEDGRRIEACSRKELMETIGY